MRTDSSTPAAPTLPAYSQSPDAMLARFRALEQAHPDLIEIRDIGDSAAKVNGKGGHDIWAVVLTDETKQSAKPVVANLGAVHGSELVAPTLLAEFAEQLANGFGRDAQTTHLLRNREIHLVPMVNPDGVDATRAMLAGNPKGSYGRPNANGVNINRNFPVGWGGNGADLDPQSGNYRGPTPASEPETQAVISHFEAHRPSIFLDWHNSGRQNLYSWGETKQDGPVADAQRSVAVRFAKLNHHEALHSKGLYPTSGNTTDWAHSRFGATALTIETGNEDFWTDAEYDQIRRENMPVLFDAAAIAEAPVRNSRGPSTSPANRWKEEGKRAMVGAYAFSGSERDIAGAEVVFDASTKPGDGTALRASDGKFDSPEEGVETSIGRKRGPKDGLMYVRAKYDDGTWGALSAGWMKPPNPPAPGYAPGVTPET